MKLNLRVALPLLMGVAVFYSACKKTDNKPSSGPSNNEIGAAIAQNMVQSLSGAYGGASIKDGVAASPSLASTSNLKTQSTGCGFFKNDGVTLTYKQGDTIKITTTGSIDYYFLCNGNSTVGYDLTDSLTATGKAPGYSFSDIVVQDYHVKGLNTNNSNYTLNGKLKAWVDFDYTKPKSSTSVHNIYTFSDLYVHADDNFDITSGSATVESKGSTSTGSWDITATIVYLGNHKAKLTFLNQVYWVDLTTGAVSPA